MGTLITMQLPTYSVLHLGWRNWVVIFDRVGYTTVLENRYHTARAAYKALSRDILIEEIYLV